MDTTNYQYNFALGNRSSSSISTVSTNATAVNLPGAGRTIGQFYEYAGHILERKINQLASKRTAHDYLLASPEFWQLNESSSSMSTNLTAPNLAGPGRTLGLLYDYVGLQLETRLNTLALTRGGLGPDASRKRITLRMTKLGLVNMYRTSEPDIGSRDMKELKKELMKLVKYAK